MNSQPSLPAQNSPSVIAVYLTSDPSNRQAIDTAFQEAALSNGEFFAFYVNTPDMHLSRESQKTALQNNVNYAASLGAHITVLDGADPAYLIGEFCRSNSINLLVINQSPTPKGLGRFHPTFAQKISEVLQETRLMIVPGTMTVHASHLQPEKHDLKSNLLNLARIVLIIALTTIACFILDGANVDEFILAQIFILGVLACSITTGSIFWSLISAFCSDLLFVFLFAQPRLSILYNQRRLSMAIAMAFVVSLIGSYIGIKLQAETRSAKRSTWATQMLLNTTHKLHLAKTPKEVIDVTCRKLAEISERDIVYYPYEEEIFRDPVYFDVNLNVPSDHTQAEKELVIAKEALKYREPTGCMTRYHTMASYLYFPWETSSETFGVIGIRFDQQAIDPLEQMVLRNIVADGAQTLETMTQEAALQEANLQRESGLLRSNLLKALAHDIRTPLTAIIGNIANYKLSHDTMDQPEKEKLWDEIQYDSLNMYYMIENLLTAARMDSSSMPVKLQPELLSDVVESGMDYPNKANVTHPITIEEGDDLLVANMDASLIAQVVSNLVTNSIHHTPEGTPIKVRTYAQDNMAVVEVSDEGDGIKDSMKERIFDIFYTGEAPRFDSTHYLGLGLFLCKAIIDAHHGTIEVHDNEPHGCVFSFRIPLLSIA